MGRMPNVVQRSRLRVRVYVQQNCRLHGAHKRQGFVCRVPNRLLHDMDRNAEFGRLPDPRRSLLAGSEVTLAARLWGTRRHTNPPRD